MHGIINILITTAHFRQAGRVQLTTGNYNIKSLICISCSH